MSIHKRVDSKHQQSNAVRDGVLFYSGGSTCFHCGQAVWSPDAILWRGNDEDGEHRQILFHHGCALEFGIRLFSDVHKMGGNIYVKKAAR